LSRCADTPINMISGGEKKRVNIGSEPLTDPAIVFLNEPTSGLDSTSAVALMRILHDLARDEGKTIIMSIHQPSSVVFFAFDALMLLADGKVVYLGTPNGSLEYVRDMGLECPRGTIPQITTWICSWWMARSRTTTTTTTTTMTAAMGTTEKEKAIRRGGVEDDGSGSSTKEEDGRWDDHEVPAHRLVGRQGVRKAHQGRGRRGAGNEI
jgi:ABC-type multidrug transport system ATPase subunit